MLCSSLLQNIASTIIGTSSVIIGLKLFRASSSPGLLWPIFMELCLSGCVQRPSGAAAMGGALARPSWLSSPTLGRANRFLSTAAVSLMTPRRPLAPPEKVKVRTLPVEQRTEEDSKLFKCLMPARTVITEIVNTVGTLLCSLFPTSLDMAYGIHVSLCT